MTSGIAFENVKKAALLCEQLSATQGDIAIYRPGENNASLSVSFSSGSGRETARYKVSPEDVFKCLREQEASLIAELRGLGVICDYMPVGKKEAGYKAAKTDAKSELLKDLDLLPAAFTSEQELHRVIKGKTGDITGPKYFEDVSDNLQFHIALVRRSDVVDLIHKYSVEVSDVEK